MILTVSVEDLHFLIDIFEQYMVHGLKIHSDKVKMNLEPDQVQSKV